MGHVFDFVHISRNILWLTQYLKMIKSGFTIAKSNSFNIPMDILSCSKVLQISSYFIILIISLSSSWTKESLSSLIQVCVSSVLLLLSNRVQWEAKKQLKWFAFSLNRPLEMKKILGGGGWVFIKKCWPTWSGRSLNWNRLKCPEILNNIEVGNANFPHIC